MYTNSWSLMERKLFSKISHCSLGTPYGKQTLEELEPLIFDIQYSNLINFNLSMITWLRKKFGIETEMVHSSALDVDEFSSSDLILEICKKLDAKAYLCGDSGKEYLSLGEFSKNKIDVEWQGFEHPVYTQVGNGFIPYLSSLDFVFNYGSQSKQAFEQLILGEKNERS